MARIQLIATPEGPQIVELTEQENKERDAEEAAWAAAANDRAFAELRIERNRKLDATDWWVMRGSITEAQTNYRQALRDLPATADPTNITWPEMPSKED
jgi:hypothetical protein